MKHIASLRRRSAIDFHRAAGSLLLPVWLLLIGLLAAPMQVQAQTGLSFAGVVADQNLTAGVSASVDLPAAEGGSSPYTFTLNSERENVINGLTFDADPTPSGTLTFSGTPRAATTTTLTYTVTDSATPRATFSLTFSINVAAGAGICGRTAQVTDAIVAEARKSDANVSTCADVSNTHLAAIAQLDVEGESITELLSGDFAGLSNLTSLDLDNNILTNLPADIFDGLTKLTSLFLRNNSLNTLPTGIFDDLTELTSLSLSNNILTNLPADIFNGLTELTSLHLHSNSLVTLPTGVFDDLTKLTRLTLSATGRGNRLTNVQPGVFEPVLDTLTFLTTNPRFFPRRASISSSAAISVEGGVPLVFSFGLGSGNAPLRVGFSYQVSFANGASAGDFTYGAGADASCAAPENGQVVIASGVDAVNLTFCLGEDADDEADESITITLTQLTPLKADGSTVPAAFPFAKLVALPSDQNDRSTSVLLDDPANFPYCGRTPEVLNAIITAIADPAVTTCRQVTDSHLAGIERLVISNTQVAQLVAGDFAGLSALERLEISGNRNLRELPAGIFDNLPQLTRLHIYDNAALSEFAPGIFDGQVSAALGLRLDGNALNWPSLVLFDADSATDIIEGQRWTTTLRLSGADPSKPIAPLPFDVHIPYVVETSFTAGFDTTSTGCSTPLSGTLTYEAGEEIAAEFTFCTNADNTPNTDEFFQIQVTDPELRTSGGQVISSATSAFVLAALHQQIPAHLQVDVFDQESVNVSDAEAIEGEEISFVVSLTFPHSEDVVLRWSTADGTAVAPGDYTAVSDANLTIPAGETEGVLRVTTSADADAISETFNVELHFGNTATTAATGTILPTLAFNPTTQVNLTLPQHQAYNLDLPVAIDGTADYTYTLNGLDSGSFLGMTFNGGVVTQPTLSGMPTASPGVDYVLTFTVTDANNLSQMLSFQIRTVSFFTFLPDPPLVDGLTFTVFTGDSVDLTLPVARTIINNAVVVYTLKGLGFGDSRVLPSLRFTAGDGIAVPSKLMGLTRGALDVGDHLLTFIATDGVSSPLVQVFTLSINALPLEIHGTVDDQTFNAGDTIPTLTLPTARGGGAGQRTYTLNGKEGGEVVLPGLNFAVTPNPLKQPTLTLFGRPTVVGRRAFTLTVTDVVSETTNVIDTVNNRVTPVTTRTTTTASLTFRYTFAAPPLSFEFKQGNIGLALGRSYDLTLPALLGGIGDVGYTLSGVSNGQVLLGLTFNGEVDPPTLRGTPTTRSANDFNYAATDAFRQQRAQNFRISANTLAFELPSVDSMIFAFTAGDSVDLTLPVASRSSAEGSVQVNYNLHSSGYGNFAAFTGDGNLPNLTFIAGSGSLPSRLTGTTRGALDVGDYVLTYSATDISNNGAQPQVFTLRFNALPLEFVPDRQNNLNYQFGATITDLKLPSVTGGVGVYTFTLNGVTSGNEVPGLAGLTFTSTVDSGTLSGTPEMTASVNLTFTVRDAAGTEKSLEFLFTVSTFGFAGMQPDLTFTAGTRIDNVVLPDALGGSGAYQYTLTSTPSGLARLAFNPSSHTLSGTPTPDGTFAMTYTVTDSSLRAEEFFSIIVNARPAFDQSGTGNVIDNGEYLVDATTGALLTPLRLPEALGGTGVITYTLISPSRQELSDDGSLDGLEFDLSERSLSGTLSGNGGFYIWRAVDSRNSRVELRFCISVTGCAGAYKGLNKALLPDIAKLIIDANTSALSERIRTAFGTRDAGKHGNAAFNLGGQSDLDKIIATQSKAMADDKLDWKQLIAKSSFVLPRSALPAEGELADAVSEHGAPARETPQTSIASALQPDAMKPIANLLNLATASHAKIGASSLAFWGTGDYRSLGGDPDGNDIDLDWSGGLYSLHFGADLMLKPRTLAGLAVSWSESKIDYTRDDDDGTNAGAGGEHILDMVTLSPYFAWRAQDGELDLWASVGFGEGRLEIREDDSADGGSDAGMNSISAGISGDLLETPKGTRVRVKGETLNVSMKIDPSETVAGVDVEVHRLRLLVEASRARNLGNGIHIVPSLEAGLRYDYGDGDLGSAIELHASIRQHNRTSGWSMHAGAYALLGRDDYQEWGLRGSLNLTQPQARGLRISLSPSYGAVQDDISQIWQKDLPTATESSADAVDNYAPSMELRASYRLPTPGGHGWLTPFGEATYGEDARTYGFGVEWKLDKLFELDLTNEISQKYDRAAENAVLLKGTLQF